jgi:hypothetical protein
MAATRKYDRVRVLTATIGTGSLTPGGAASSAWQTFAEAGVPDGAPVTVLIEDGTDFELVSGVYSTTGPTLSRDTVLRSKIGGTAGTAKISLSGAAIVSIVPVAADFKPLRQLNALRHALLGGF